MARILGLDVGIGSVGWAVVETGVDEATGEVTGAFEVVVCGARCFDVPEVPKTKDLKNKARRLFRGQRRVTRRRRQRLQAVRRALRARGLPVATVGTPPGTPAGRVWGLRAAGLDRRLEPVEWSAVLVHIAKHRGFRSNSKRDRDNRSEGGKLLRQIAETGQKLAGFRTFGEMLAPKGSASPPPRMRNVPDDYRLTPLRRDLEVEAGKLFEAQRRFGNPAADATLEAAYRDAAFFQRPFDQGDLLVGACRFEPAEKRCPKQSPSFERFRFLSKLNNTRIHPIGEPPRFLSAEERARAKPLFASVQKLTFKAVRKQIGLPAGTVFDGLATRKGDPEAATFAVFDGSRMLAQPLGEQRFHELQATHPSWLDDAMEALVFNETPERITAEMERAGLDGATIAQLTTDAALAAASAFKGVGHISALACRKLMPGLEDGLVYSAACEKAGYDHSAIGESRIADIRNSVVSKVLREAKKQIEVIVAEHGMPDLVHFEMARDVGKSAEERGEIKKGLDERTAERERHAAEYETLLGRAPNGDELLRFEMWKEQSHRCPYTGDYISPAQLAATDNSVQVDHILPYSRSGDDSFRNKVLCAAKANQDKRRRTAFEWFGDDAARWAEFKTRIEGSPHLHKQKKRNLLTTAFKEREEGYRERHLNDTRYALRVLRMEIERMWPVLATRKDERRRIFVRPGAVTAMVRKSWGLNSLKASGELGDRDHALDAIVLACTSERLLQQLTRAAQELEEIGSGRATPLVPTPFGSEPADRERLRQLVAEKVRAVFVSRPETRRGRGPAHKSELFAFKPNGDGSVTRFKRIAVDELKRDHLKLLKGGDRADCLRQQAERWLAEALAKGHKEGKLQKWAATNPLRAPSRDGAVAPVVRHLRIELPERVRGGIEVVRGSKPAHADTETMVRVDVFAKEGRFFLVPIYELTVTDKRELARLLVADTVLDGQRMSVLTGIERMVDGLLAAITAKDAAKLPLPEPAAPDLPG
jgi:CRISPR-associated endonuclease Csn1